MPIYEYRAQDPKRKSCALCQQSFDQIRRISDPPLTHCPQCGAPVVKLISSPSLGISISGLDDRAKAAGFHKLKKTVKGEYEKKY
jgi:putative FmdB family regulatory protein